MRAVIQRVSSCRLAADGRPHAAIGPGLLVLLGIEAGCEPDDTAWLADRVARLRVFPDDEGRMNRSPVEAGMDVMVVSQFTLFGSLKKGNRPSFNRSAEPAEAEPAYERFVGELAERLGKPVATGVFGADMTIDAGLDGPVTLIVDTRERGF